MGPEQNALFYIIDFSQITNQTRNQLVVKVEVRIPNVNEKYFAISEQRRRYHQSNFQTVLWKHFLKKTMGSEELNHVCNGLTKFWFAEESFFLTQIRLDTVKNKKLIVLVLNNIIVT